MHVLSTLTHHSIKITNEEYGTFSKNLIENRPFQIKEKNQQQVSKIETIRFQFFLFFYFGSQTFQKTERTQQ